MPENPCLDCGASAGQPCADTCPSAITADLVLVDAGPEPICCASPAEAAALLCGCGGVAGYGPNPCWPSPSWIDPYDLLGVTA